MFEECNIVDISITYNMEIFGRKDAKNEKNQEKIKNIIKNLSKDHTVIIVAHRLSTIIDSDCIFVLNNHEIIDSGTHNELIKKCPEYKNLYEIEG